MRGAGARTPVDLQIEGKNNRSRQANRVRKQRALAVVSNNEIRCKRCGIDDTDVLTIDHVHDDGAEERRSLGSAQLQEALIRGRVDISRYQLLCANCNLKKAIQSHKDGVFRRKGFTPRVTRDQLVAEWGSIRQVTKRLNLSRESLLRHVQFYGLDISAQDSID